MLDFVLRLENNHLKKIRSDYCQGLEIQTIEMISKKSLIDF